MNLRLHELRPAAGARRNRKRVGRGTGSGHGKTAGRGTKGQLARSGGGKGPGFEGGQTPLQRRIPKRGFKNEPFRKRLSVVNLEQLDRFEAGTVVTPQLLKESGVLKKIEDGVKVLGEGELTKALTVRAHGFSKSAAEKIAAAGGKVEVI